MTLFVYEDCGIIFWPIVHENLCLSLNYTDSEQNKQEHFELKKIFEFAS